MPVRSLSSSVLVWPDRKAVLAALRNWAEAALRSHRHVARVGCFGSYARGTASVGSDLDIVVLVRESSLAFERRPVEWDTTALPVPADLLIYTLEEWERRLSAPPLQRAIEQEAVWIAP